MDLDDNGEKPNCQHCTTCDSYDCYYNCLLDSPLFNKNQKQKTCDSKNTSVQEDATAAQNLKGSITFQGEV